jgi:C-terminal processing protease CtpA/Prc
MRRLSIFLGFIFFIFAGLRLIQRSVISDGVHSICTTVSEHFYRTDGGFQAWVDDCFEQARSVGLWTSQAAAVTDLQELMDRLGVSHFRIYTPQEDSKIWKGEAVDTGVRARWVEDHLVVFFVYKGSEGEKAGVKPGDDIIAIDGSTHVSPWGVQNRAGKYLVQRRKKKMEIAVNLGPLQVDSAPQLRDLGNGTGLLAISSFRSEYFAAASWRRMVSRLQAYSHLVIDIRDNVGGNFVAMLRALSSFTCEVRGEGVLIQPRKVLPDLTEIPDEMSDDFQIKELDKYHSIRLKTFSNYGCYSQPITVLIDSNTASVSEIFAQAMRFRPNTRLWGQPTSGDVVLAVWYDLPLFGRGYSISIPEAVYLTENHESLEGQGVYPEQELYYDLPTALRGEDSWIDRAVHQPY